MAPKVMKSPTHPGALASPNPGGSTRLTRTTVAWRSLPVGARAEVPHQKSLLSAIGVAFAELRLEGEHAGIVAQVLNRMGIRNARGHEWTELGGAALILALGTGIPAEDALREAKKKKRKPARHGA